MIVDVCVAIVESDEEPWLDGVNVDTFDAIRSNGEFALHIKTQRLEQRAIDPRAPVNVAVKLPCLTGRFDDQTEREVKIQKTVHVNKPTGQGKEAVHVL